MGRSKVETDMKKRERRKRIGLGQIKNNSVKRAGWGRLIKKEKKKDWVGTNEEKGNKKDSGIGTDCEKGDEKTS